MKEEAESVSGTWDPPATIRPFPWDRFKRFTREEVQILRHLEVYLPHPVVRAQVAQTLSERLRDLLGGPINFWLDRTQVVKATELAGLVASPTVLACVAIAPSGPRGLIEIDPVLAQGCIELLLGISSDGQTLSPLTDVEEGVITFLLLEVLKIAQGHWSDGATRRLRLLGMSQALEGFRDVLTEDKRFGVINVRASIGPYAGFIRLLLPWGSISQLRGIVAAEELGEAEQEAFHQWLGNSMKRLSHCSTTLRALIGSTTLSGSELNAIGVGDVIVMDEAAVSEGLEDATVLLKVGRGRSGQIHGSMTYEEGACSITIDRIEIVKEPEMTSRKAGRGSEFEGTVGEEGEEVIENQSGSPLPESVGLLSDVPILLSVEVGRIQLNADEVLALRPGQVITFDRSPTDPVDLVVNGRLIAQGELVHVEGQIGVRIVKLR